MKAISAVVCAFLVAGATASVREVNADSGDYYAFSTPFSLSEPIEKCQLTTPAGVTLTFTPGAASPYGDRYELQPIDELLPRCSVVVKNLQASDNGPWEIAFVTSSGTGAPQGFNLVITGTGGAATEDNNNDDTESEEMEEMNENVRWLNTIRYPARVNQTIDISLSHFGHHKECYLLTPDKRYVKASKANIEGVKIHPLTFFVSCRITIGPMTEELIGDWALCEKYTENDDNREKCQPANIYWNPQADWQVNEHSLFNHPVHKTSMFTPAVIGNGDIVTCHIITPNGEDLIVDENSSYPSVRATRADSTCTFIIGPIRDTLLGDWEIYGIFTNFVQGLNEERFPFRIFYYDEENPYNQAYNLTVLEPLTRAVALGKTLSVEVGTNMGQVDNCYILAPSGQIYEKSEQNNMNGVSFDTGNHGSVSCRAVIGPVTEELLGDWKITGKFSNNGVFTERRQTLYLILEDPENPIQEDRLVIDLPAQTVTIEFEHSDRFVIPSHEFVIGESCHIRTPKGLQYQIMKGFNTVDGVEIIVEYDVECGVVITVVSEDVFGEWTLIARATQHSVPIERRLNFTIYTTGSVAALQDAVTLTEGDDLYVSLKEPTPYHETCKLIGPYGFECETAVRDPERVEYCGYIRRNVQPFNSGTWTITFGERNEYKAKIAVTVNAGDSAGSTSPEHTFSSTFDLVRDRSVDQFVGPENAVYCRLEDPQGLVVFDNFGRCRLTLDVVELQHNGVWKMFVAAPGKILTEEYQLVVSVIVSEGKALVTTNVTQAKPIVTVSCSVQADAVVTGCKFRNPQGKILIANSGLSEDRYQSYGRGSSSGSGSWSHECGIIITGPLTTDLGLWRCALETANETYYGHMPVLCPWALSNPDIAATVQQEPILRATRSLVNVVEEAPATMSCTVESVIRYCYFRAANGTVYTVSPDMSSSSMEYVGAGFDAGECGIRFHGLNAADGGRWSCHVGLPGVADEQRDLFQVTVHERMQVRHFTGHGNVMTVEGIVYEGRALDYCRFVRIDGFGFTSDNVPSQYTLTGILANGECQFTARNPTILDLHPWTVVARIRGQDVEIAKDTMESVIIGGPEPEPEEEDNPGIIIFYRNNGFVIFMYVLMAVLLVSILLGALLGPKKNREWTSQRATALRRSVSNSFKKEQPQNPTSTYTP